MMQQTLIYVFLMLGCLASSGIAGSTVGNTMPAEEVNLFTDRSLYISGEWIRISALVSTGKQSAGKIPSNTLYVELIDSEMERVLGRKFRIEDQRCSAALRIPGHLENGTYFLKSYTRQMRNHGPAGYAYNALKIINPFSDTLACPPETGEMQYAPENASFAVRESPVLLSTDQTRYGVKDSIHIHVQLSGDTNALELACISVVPSDACRPLLYQDPVKETSKPLRYMPEWHGVSLSGTLTKGPEGDPLPNRRIDLSVLEARAEFMSAYTNAEGRFYFSFPEDTGQINLFIAASGNDLPVNSLRVDHDFSPLNPELPEDLLGFHLQAREKERALLLARNYQISRAFSRKPENDPDGRYLEDTVHFYGKPTEVLDMDEYIQLPVLEDYLNELPFTVKVRRNQGRKELRVLGSSPGLQVYDPLVLLDGVPVYNLEAVLSIPSGKISHVEIINETYVKGNLKCGGIVSIHSREKDFAGIQLPASGIFLPYHLWDDAPQPEAGGAVLRSSADVIPDHRNTLLWRDDLRLHAGTSQTIGFQAGQTRGSYEVVLQGIQRSGKRLIQKITFTIQ